jgi:hypothetical protein
MEALRGSPRRRLLVVTVLAVVIIAGVVGSTMIKHSGQPVRSVAATCSRLTDAKDLDRSLTSLDPATLRERFGALHDAVRTAPTDIEPQIATLSAFVSELIDDVDRAASADRRVALADALSARADQIDSITDAGAEVQVWAATNCQIELGDASTSSSSIAP